MSMTVIDVRTEAEWGTGHLEGALHIEWQDILNISSHIQKDQEKQLKFLLMLAILMLKMQAASKMLVNC